MEQVIHNTTVNGPSRRAHARLPRISASGRFLGPAASILCGGVIAAAAWAALLPLPEALAMDGLSALAGAGALLYLGFAAISARVGAALGNLAAFAGVLAWTLIAPAAVWALATGLFLHAAACGLNAWRAGEAVAVSREIPLGLGVSALGLGVLILTAGI